MHGEPVIPERFCRILEPDNPDFNERFECNDCGENFITLCDAKRLKERVKAAEAKVAEQAADIADAGETIRHYLLQRELADAKIALLQTSLDQLVLHNGEQAATIERMTEERDALRGANEQLTA